MVKTNDTTTFCRDTKSPQYLLIVAIYTIFVSFHYKIVSNVITLIQIQQCYNQRLIRRITKPKFEVP